MLLVARAARVAVVLSAVLHLMCAEAAEAAVDPLDEGIAVGWLHLLVLRAGRESMGTVAAAIALCAVRHAPGRGVLSGRGRRPCGKHVVL